MKETVKNQIVNALTQAKENGDLNLSEMPDIVIEEPKDEKLGDFATTLAMQLARSEKKNPKLIAETICGFLNDGADSIESAEVAGPGFINIKMSKDFFLSRFKEAILQGREFGQSDVGQNKKVLLEFVSANPTGPLHVGHGRGASQCACTNAVSLSWLAIDGTAPRYTQSWAVLRGTSSSRAKWHTVNPFTASHGFKSTISVSLLRL